MMLLQNRKTKARHSLSQLQFLALSIKKIVKHLQIEVHPVMLSSSSVAYFRFEGLVSKFARVKVLQHRDFA